MARKSIPRRVKDIVLKEYNHKCAICGSDQPHLHHIDENPLNNEVVNLVPLCPNCHLRDQHNPTRKIDIHKLQLFRKYKDPIILKPQFHPIFERQKFLFSLELNDESIDDIYSNAKELADFVSSLEMGDFYGKRIKELTGPINWVMTLDAGYESKIKEKNIKYRKKIINNRGKIESLIIELLRYQNWGNY